MKHEKILGKGTLRMFEAEMYWTLNVLRSSMLITITCKTYYLESDLTKTLIRGRNVT